MGEPGLFEERLHGFLVHSGEGPARLIVARHAPVLAEFCGQQAQHVEDQVAQLHQGP